jgi:hypothetical protein
MARGAFPELACRPWMAKPTSGLQVATSERYSPKPIPNALRLTLLGVAASVAIATSFPAGPSRSAPPPEDYGASYRPTWVEAAIERQPICVGSTVASAGKLGDVLYYRSSFLDDGRLLVGYYAFFSEERPWGNNWLTWTVLPALAVDLMYTHTLFFGPGIQRFAYGKEDVEGFRIVYDLDERGRLVTNYAVADSGYHGEVQLLRSELFSVDSERPTVYSNWWSHQLGGRGAHSPGDLTYRRCYEPESIRRLPPEVATDFRLMRRAAPARVAPALHAFRSDHRIPDGTLKGRPCSDRLKVDMHIDKRLRDLGPHASEHDLCPEQL